MKIITHEVQTDPRRIERVIFELGGEPYWACYLPGFSMAETVNDIVVREITLQETPYFGWARLHALPPGDDPQAAREYCPADGHVHESQHMTPGEWEAFLADPSPTLLEVLL